MERPPRVLVATVLTGPKLHAFGEWEASLRAQRTFLMWDVLLAYVYEPAWLHQWAKRDPFGQEHRVRLRAPSDRAAGQQQVWAKFAAWSSYELLLLLDADVVLSPTYLQQLYDADAPWAAGEAPPGQAFSPLSASLTRREALEEGLESLPITVPAAHWSRIPERRQVAELAR